MIKERYSKTKEVKHSVVYKPKSAESPAKGMTIYVPKSAMPKPDGPYPDEVMVTVEMVAK